MALSTHNEKSNAGQSWKAYDVGHSMVHFFLPVQRARLNLESLWLGQVSTEWTKDIGPSKDDYSIINIIP